MAGKDLKKLKHGGVSVLFILFFTAAVVMVNIIAGLVSERFDAKIDLTENRLYTIEESTSAYLKSLNVKITVTVASRESDFTMLGVTYNQTNEIIRKFAATAPDMTVKYVDLMQNPALSGQYGGALTQTAVVIESERGYRVLDAKDYLLLTYYDSQGNKITAEEYQMYAYYGMAYYDISAAAEQAFLSAIMAVTDENPVYVGISGGFGEIKNTVLESLLGKNVYITKDINLVTEEIGSDIDFLLLFSPASDYSADVLSKVELWLDNNGMFDKTLIYVASVANPDTPNTDAFLKEWGIEVQKGEIMESNPAYYSYSAGQYQILTLEPVAYQERLNPNYKIYGIGVRPSKLLFSEYSNFITTPLISTQESAFMYPFDAIGDENWEPDENDAGRLNAAVESKKLRYEGFDEHISRVIVFGSIFLLSEEVLSMENANNAEYFLGMIGSISGRENAAAIAIAPKSFSVATFQINAEASSVIGFIFAIALPLVILSLGVAIWLKRRFR